MPPCCAIVFLLFFCCVVRLLYSVVEYYSWLVMMCCADVSRFHLALFGGFAVKYWGNMLLCFCCTAIWILVICPIVLYCFVVLCGSAMLWFVGAVLYCYVVLCSCLVVLCCCVELLWVG